MSDELFTTTMKKATRKAHAISDALVNAKLLFALNNDSIWAEGLLIFYEIFKFLETAMKERKEENLGKLYMAEMDRTDAFESDLNFFLGENWKQNYQIRDSVKFYLKHLQQLLETDSDLLMAYVYHLYMGLMSGGQILRKKRQLKSKLLGLSQVKLGEAITDFGETKISDLKMKLKDRMNSIAEGLDESKKNSLVEESIKVFEFNNFIIRSVKGSEKIAIRNIFMFGSFFALVLSIICYFLNKKFEFK